MSCSLRNYVNQGRIFPTSYIRKVRTEAVSATGVSVTAHKLASVWGLGGESLFSCSVQLHVLQSQSINKELHSWFILSHTNQLCNAGSWLLANYNVMEMTGNYKPEWLEFLFVLCMLEQFIYINPHYITVNKTVDYINNSNRQTYVQGSLHIPDYRNRHYICFRL